jgi:hypothetical protein
MNCVSAFLFWSVHLSVARRRRRCCRQKPVWRVRFALSSLSAHFQCGRSVIYFMFNLYKRALTPRRTQCVVQRQQHLYLPGTVCNDNNNSLVMCAHEIHSVGRAAENSLRCVGRHIRGLRRLLYLCVARRIIN